MTNTLVEWDAETNEDILVAPKAAALVNSRDQQLQESKVETLWRYLGNAEGQSTYGGCCLDSTRGALPPMAKKKIKAINDTLGEVDSSEVVHAWANTVCRVQIRTVHYTVAQLVAEALITTRSKALA